MSETLNAQDIAKKLQEQLTSLSATVDTHEVSTVDEVGDGIARVSGLKSAMAGELLEFKSSDTGETVFGLAQNLDRDEVGAVLFGAVDSIKEGDECRTTGRIMDIPVSRAMLGRVVNPLGQPIDGLGDIVATHRRPIEFKAPGVIDRTPVCEPVQTGLLAIDSMVPIGRGQRELIIGDRKTGKTAIAIDAILNQRGKGMVCIYVAIGQKASTVANIRETLAQHGALDYTIIVSATAADSAPMQYIAPMAGAAIGEFFMYNGEDGKPASETNPGGHVLVIYDDRSKQAEPYKEALTDVMLTVAGDASCSGTDPMLQRHETVKRGLIVVIASDRGLAGGFNTTVERTAEKLAASWANNSIECEIIACGRKPATYFRDRANVIMHFEGNSSEPDFNQARMISSHICDAYRAGELDRVELVYHHAKNRVDQELRVEHLLPLDPEMIAMAHGPRKNETDAPKRISSTFEFVPSPEHVLGKLVPSYILTVIYQALIDSAAAEQGARRKAMHSATENATAIISTLTRTYSRVRQASITTEINEIVGGASALEEQ